MDYIDCYYNDVSILPQCEDFETAKKKAFSVVLPFIMKQELTERQYACVKFKYDSGKSQEEIAELLHLSQPTVSRHINTAKKILNSNLKYCYAAVTAALTEYERLEQSCGY